MRALTVQQHTMLRAPFRRPAGVRELVGVEIEAGVVDPRTGVSLSYHGARGVGTLLAEIAKRWGGDPVMEDEHLIGVRRDDGAEVGLESGCALEYVSTPVRSLAQLVTVVEADLAELSQQAESMGVALISGAMVPFNTRANLSWAPKARIPLMLAHFDREVGPQSQGWAAMSQILSAQTTLDYLSHDDLVRKHRMANAVSVIVAALFVNSPVHERSLTVAQSRRMQIWTNVDSRRVGILERSLADSDPMEDVIQWALDLPLIFRHRDRRPVAPPPHRSFRSLLEEGYGDGTAPILEDWLSLLSTTWPYVRLRSTIELRIADGPRHDAWAAGPALWVGLAYDPEACAAAWSLTRKYTVKEHLRAIDDVALHGLDARLGGDSVLDLACELLRIADGGLARRVEAGLEPAFVRKYLEPLREVVDEKLTFAQRLRARWDRDYQRNPRLYVEDHRWPSTVHRGGAGVLNSLKTRSR